MTKSTWRGIRVARVAVAAVMVGALGLSPIAAQEGPELPEPYREPIPYQPAVLGPYSFPISSESAEAQQFFDQGMQLMYAFAKVDAVRSFRAAWAEDPDCAICYWGEAWAWGSYLNGPMRPPEAPHAWAALQKALALAADGHGTARERDYIDALSVRYVESFDVAKRREQDEAYAEAMKALSERYPDDLDAASLYGDALFLLEPRRGTRDLDDPNVQRLHGVLEGVLARDIEHPGACHLYIHATESTVDPGKAEACAEHLGTAIPGASHINHMPSHTWNEVGRWADGVRANIRAWHSDLKAADGGGEGVAIYPTHNLHMLLFAASMDGQGAVAIQAGKDYQRLTGDSVHHVLTLLRFGRFAEVLAVTDRPENEVSAGLYDFAQGYAHLRTGAADFAEVFLRARAAPGRNVGSADAVPSGREAARRRGRHPRGRAAARAGRHRRRGRRLRARGRAGRRAGLRRARAAAVRGPALARRAPDRARPARRGRAGVPRRDRRPPPQRLVALRPEDRHRGPGPQRRGGRRRPRGELGAVGHLDQGVAVLSRQGGFE